jgi:hypothetical protein
MTLAEGGQRVSAGGGVGKGIASLISWLLLALVTASSVYRCHDSEHSGSSPF